MADEKEYKVNSFIELHNILSQYKENKLWFFRGQSDILWDIKPKVGREPYVNIHDKQVFNAFKRQAIEYVNNRPLNDWEWLAIAQHHGLATRLLDWTNNPLNAAFFAVYNYIEKMLLYTLFNLNILQILKIHNQWINKIYQYLDLIELFQELLVKMVFSQYILIPKFQ